MGGGEGGKEGERMKLFITAVSLETNNKSVQE